MSISRMSCIPAKTYTMDHRSSNSWKRPETTRASRSITIRRISFCSASIMSGSSDVYASKIKAFHVKDAEFRPSPKSGVYGAYLPWKERPGRFRSLGDGQVDFTQVFSRLTAGGYKSWAVIEWECTFKDSVQGATEGAPFVEKHLITVPSRAFDDFAGAATNAGFNRRVLGLK